MSENITSLIVIAVVAITLIFAPVKIQAVYNVVYANDIVSNSCNSFVDTVTDKGSITPQDLRNLALSLSESGITYEYFVEVKRRVVYKGHVEYLIEKLYDKSDINKASTNRLVDLHSGDLITVRAKPITKLNAARLIESLTGIAAPSYSISMSGTVR